jgi:hypothetical protein
MSQKISDESVVVDCSQSLGTLCPSRIHVVFGDCIKALSSCADFRWTTLQQCPSKDAPGTVYSWNGVRVCTGMFKESENIISGDDTRRDDIR